MARREPIPFEGDALDLGQAYRTQLHVVGAYRGDAPAQFAERAQFRGGETSLRRPSVAHDMNVAHSTIRQCIKGNVTLSNNDGYLRFGQSGATP